MDDTRNPDPTIRPHGAENGHNGPVVARTPTRSTASPSGVATASPRAVSDPPALAPRDRTFLAMLADGLTQGEIATRMHLSPEAVGTAVARLRERLGARTTAHMVHRGHELGLLGERPVPRWSCGPGTGQVLEVLPPVERGSALSRKPRATAADARLIAARLEASMRRDGS